MEKKFLAVYSPPFFEAEEDQVHQVVLTSEGKLIELDKNSTVVCSLQLLKDSCSDSAVIRTIHTYDPHFKHYLILTNSLLYIVKKVSTDDLILIETLESVRDFYVEDVDGQGFPKLGVFYEGRNAPLVFNISNWEERNSTPKVVGSALLKVGSHIQSMNVQLLKAQQVLADKRKFISSVAGNNSPFDDENGIHMIPMMNNTKFTEVTAHKTPLTCSKPWVRIFPDHWVIGIFVINNSDNKLNHMLLTALGSSFLIEECQVFLKCDLTTPQNSSNYKRTHILPPHTEGCLVGLLKEPFHSDRSLSIPLILSFRNDNASQEESVYVREINITVQEVLSGICVPYGKGNEVPDFLSVLASTRNISIDNIFLGTRELNDLKEAFCELGFHSLSQEAFFYKFGCLSPLQGILIELDAPRNKIIIHYKKEQQLVLIITLLEKHILQLVKVDNALTKKLISNCVSSLNEELKLVQQFFKSVESSGAASGPIAVPKQICQQIFSKSKETDINFLLLSQEN